MYSKDEKKVTIGVPDKVIRGGKSYSDKFIMLIANLNLKKNRENRVGFSIASLAVDMGYKPNSAVGMINEEIKTMLNTLEDSNNLCAVNGNINDFRINDYACIEINPNSFLFNTKEDYTIINLSEYNAILNIEGGIPKPRLFRLYSAIKSYYYTGAATAFVCPTYEQLATNIGISRGANLYSLIDALEGSGIITVGRYGYYKDDMGEPKKIPNFYGLDGKAVDMSRDSFLMDRQLFVTEHTTN